MPQCVTVSQLETLLNGLLANEERLSYQFFLQDVQLADSLGAHLLNTHVNSVNAHDVDLSM